MHLGACTYLRTGLGLGVLNKWAVYFFLCVAIWLGGNKGEGESGSSRVLVKLYKIELYLNHTLKNQGLILMEGKDLGVDFDEIK